MAFVNTERKKILLIQIEVLKTKRKYTTMRAMKLQNIKRIFLKFN